MALRVLVGRAGYQGSRRVLAAAPILGKDFTWFRDGLDGQLYHTAWTTGPLSPQEAVSSAMATFSSTIGASPLPLATISIPPFDSSKPPRAFPQKAVQYEHSRGASLIPATPHKRPPVTDFRPFSTEAVRNFHKSAIAAEPSDLDKAARWQQRVAARKKRQAQAYPAEYEEVEAQQPHADTSVVPEIPAPTQPLVGALEPRSLEEAQFASVLARSDLIMTRKVEWANLLIGFEQQNKYTIVDPYQPDQPVGFVVEESNPLLRQLLRSRRPFEASVLDAQGREIIKIKRPFFFINSTITVETPSGVKIGEAHRRWHLWKRNYDSYVGQRQFGEVENWGFWWWTFEVKGEEGKNVAVIDRNWRGFGYELMTDAGQYCVRFGDATGKEGTPKLESLAQHGLPMTPTGTAGDDAGKVEISRQLTLSERAVVLALAISLDNDYFSRHAGGAGGFFPFPFFGSEATDSRAEESDPPGTAPVPTGASVPPEFRPSDDTGGGIGGMVAGTAMADAMHGGMDRGENPGGSSSADAASPASGSIPSASDGGSEWISRDVPSEDTFGADDTADDGWEGEGGQDSGWFGGDDDGGGGSWFDVFGDGE